MEINAHVEERDRHFDELTHQEEEPKLLRLLYLVWYDKEPYSDELYSANLDQAIIAVHFDKNMSWAAKASWIHSFTRRLYCHWEESPPLNCAVIHVHISYKGTVDTGEEDWERDRNHYEIKFGQLISLSVVDFYAKIDAIRMVIKMANLPKDQILLRTQEAVDQMPSKTVRVQNGKVTQITTWKLWNRTPRQEFRVWPKGDGDFLSITGDAQYRDEHDQIQIREGSLEEVLSGLPRELRELYVKAFKLEEPTRHKLEDELKKILPHYEINFVS